MAPTDDILARLKRLHPLLIDLSLGRMQRLLAKLGSPEQRLPPVIHVAGTNGKGSLTAYLKAMLEAAGRRAHVYTSPHLVRFNERIVLADADVARPITDDALSRLLDRVERVNGSDPITFFEVTTAAAFLAFAEAPADALILEVGLGGRLDATNVVARPRLTVITSISMDHADKLGDTLAKIAAEKAGIMKPGVVCVVSRQPAEVDRVIEREAGRIGAMLLRAGVDFDTYEQAGRLIFQSESRLLDLPLPSLVGRHQIANAGTAVAAALELPELGLTEAAIARGLVGARWPARMQCLGEGPLPALLPRGSELWLDGGHNPGAGEMIAQTLADLEERSPRPLYLVVGMMGQKDAAGFLAPFRGLARAVLSVPVPAAHEPPHAPAALAEVARGLGLVAEPQPGVEAALERVRTLAKGPVRVLICGSLYLAGHVLALQAGDRQQSN